jgi:hypothetical protein
MFEEIAKSLVVYGPLGIFCALSLGFAYQKDRALAKAPKDFLDKQEALAKQHKEETQALLERYITKAETWMNKYQELATSQHAVIDAIQDKL